MWFKRVVTALVLVGGGGVFVVFLFCFVVPKDTEKVAVTLSNEHILSDILRVYHDRKNDLPDDISEESLHDVMVWIEKNDEDLFYRGQAGVLPNDPFNADKPTWTYVVAGRGAQRYKIRGGALQYIKVNRDKCVIMSKGVDGKWDIDEETIYNSMDNPTDLERLIIESRYDPSNGVASSGDIIRLSDYENGKTENGDIHDK